MCAVKKKIVPQKFLPRTNFSAIVLKNFVLPIFCPPGQAMSGNVFLAFSQFFSAAGCMSMFSMLYNLFHHTPRMIFDPFWAFWRATSRDILALQDRIPSSHLFIYY